MNPYDPFPEGTGLEVNIGGKKVELKTIIDEYLKTSLTWTGAEHEVRDTRAIALADGVIAKTKNGLGMDQLRSEFEHLEVSDIEKKMKEASFSDMVIMCSQLATIVPIVGDIGGGTFDLL